jgi:hypothetical protein
MMMRELSLLALVLVYDPQANDGLNDRVQVEVYFIIQMEGIARPVYFADE